MKKLFLLPLMFFALIGCAEPTKNVMPPLQHHNDINLHIPKTAYVYWVPGKQVGSDKSPSYTIPNSGNGGVGGLIADLVVSAVDSQQRKNNPSQYINQYGKADQAVFITSLRDALTNNNVFKKAELVTDSSKVGANDVLIKVHFKTARITNCTNVTLTVKLSIKTGNKPLYEKTYLVENDPNKPFKSFVDNKTDASRQLLTDVINGIKQWHEENK